MYCSKCGKEISDTAQFCPFCGQTINTQVTNIQNQGSQARIIQESVNQIKKKKTVAIVLAFIVILVLAFPVRYAVEKSIVKSIAEDRMKMIKEGPSAETMDEIFVELLYGITESEAVTDFIHEQVTGEDIKDVYTSIMRHMTYKVNKVERIDSKHYMITVYVNNMDNSKVASRAWELFSERYAGLNIFDAFAQAKEDWSSDKSTTVSSFIAEASDQLYRSDKYNNSVYGSYVINVTKEGDDWNISFEGGTEQFILNCAGLSSQ
nr:zinc ribbon domain-containing protein [uncultured Butyrivibrio sp.]